MNNVTWTVSNGGKIHKNNLGGYIHNESYKSNGHHFKHFFCYESEEHLTKGIPFKNCESLREAKKQQWVRQ